TGMSHPPNPIIFAPRRTCSACKGVVFKSVSAMNGVVHERHEKHERKAAERNAAEKVSPRAERDRREWRDLGVRLAFERSEKACEAARRAGAEAPGNRSATPPWMAGGTLGR